MNSKKGQSKVHLEERSCSLLVEGVVCVQQNHIRESENITDVVTLCLNKYQNIFICVSSSVSDPDPDQDLHGSALK